MIKIIIVLILLGLQIVLTASKELETLTAYTFDRKIKKGRFLVAFTSPTCPHCIHLEDELLKLIDLYKDQDYLKEKSNNNDLGLSLTDENQLNFATIDITLSQAEGLKKRFNIKGFPTVKYFEDSIEILEYLGQRNAEDILEFDARLKSPKVSPLNNENILNKFCFQDAITRSMEIDPVSFILLVPESNQPDPDVVVNKDILPKVIANFAKVADEKRQSHFFGMSTYNEDTKKFFKDLPSDLTLPALVKVSIEPYNEDKKYFKYDTKHLVDIKEMKDYIDEFSWPNFIELGIHNFYRISLSKHKMLVSLFLSEDSEKDQAVLKELNDCAHEETTILSKEEYSKFYFGYLPDKTRKYQRFISQYVVDLEALPRVVVLDSENKVYYEDEKMENELGICKFLQAIAQDQVDSQTDGFYGMPNRMLKKFVFNMPYSAVGLFVVIMVILLIIRALVSGMSTKITIPQVPADVKAKSDAKAKSIKNNKGKTPNEKKKN